MLERGERAVGARGLFRPHPIERIGRDLTLYLRQPAPDAALDDVSRFVLGADAPLLDLWQPSGGLGKTGTGDSTRP